MLTFITKIVNKILLNTPTLRVNKKNFKMLTRQKEISDLINCSYQNWYEDFRKNSIKSFVLPIPQKVLEYLRQDFFILPKECAPVGSSSGASFVGEESNFEDEDTEGAESDVPEFPEFSKEIAGTLKKLGKFGRFYGCRWSHLMRVISRWIRICQDELALPARLHLDHGRANIACQRPHRRVPTTQGVQHLQGRSEPGGAGRILPAGPEEVEGNPSRHRVQMLREEQKSHRDLAARLAAVPRALQHPKARHHQRHRLAVQGEDQGPVSHR